MWSELINDTRKNAGQLRQQFVLRDTGQTRQVIDRVWAERLMQLIRRYRLVLSGSDPRIGDLTVAALLKALQQAAEAAQKTALRLTGYDWGGRRCGWRGLRGGSSPPEETSEAASDCASAEQRR
jgi:hypothetical protein